MPVEYAVYYSSNTAAISTDEMDLSFLRNTMDHSSDKKEDKLKKKLQRIRSLGK